MTPLDDCLTAIEWYKKGSASLESGRHKEAVEALTKALSLDPEYAVAYRNRGNAYSKLGNYQEAITDYGRALALDPNVAAAYCSRGVVHSRLGSYRQAIADYGRTFAENREAPDILNWFMAQVRGSPKQNLLLSGR